MKKELKIEVPDGYEIDPEATDLKEGIIRYKKLPESWISQKDAKASGYFFPDGRRCTAYGSFRINWENPKIVFAREKEANSVIAFSLISQIMANDSRFGGVITDEEWASSTLKYVICRHGDAIACSTACVGYEYLAFHTQEQRDLFIAENAQLVKDFLMVDEILDVSFT